MSLWGTSTLPKYQGPAIVVRLDLVTPMGNKIKRVATVLNDTFSKQILETRCFQSEITHWIVIMPPSIHITLGTTHWDLTEKSLYGMYLTTAIFQKVTTAT